MTATTVVGDLKREAKQLSAVLQLAERRLGHPLLVYYSHSFPPRPLDVNDALALDRYFLTSRKIEKLGVIVIGEGGPIHAARRIAILLKKFSKRLFFYVPYRARSATGLICLSGTELILDNIGEIGPIDGLCSINSGGNGVEPFRIGVEDLRAYKQAVREWFGSMGREKLLRPIVDAIHPASIGAIFRADKYAEEIGCELIKEHLPQANGTECKRIVRILMRRSPEHQHPFFVDDLTGIGLNARLGNTIEKSMMRDIYTKSFELATKTQRVAGGHGASLVGIICTKNFVGVSRQGETIVSDELWQEQKGEGVLPGRWKKILANA